MEADLHDALIAWQGGELPEGRADALLARLREDREFRSAFASRVWTLSLTRIAQAPDPRWLALYEELGLSSTAEDITSDDAFEGAVMSTIRDEPVRFVAAWWRRVALAATAAAIVLALGVAIRSTRESKSSTPSGVKRQMLAVMVQADSAVWKGKERDRFASGTALGSERLQLAAGRASLIFTSGVMLEFEGPADVELLAADRVVCREGRLRTKVPKGAEGFCVETPGGAVTDLGTEFGVSVSRGGETHVAVFEGKAEVSLQIPGQDGVRTAMLNEHDRAQLLPTTGEIRPESQEPFLAASTLQLPQLSLPPEYAAAVRSARPLHYWRLDRAQNAAIPNEIPGAPPLLLAGNAAVERDAYGAASARFHGRRSPGALYLQEPWAKPATGYAFELWFASDTVEQGALVALTPADAQRLHLALVEVGSRRPARGVETGVLRFLTRFPASRYGGTNIFTAPAALPFVWHHLVAQQAGSDMQLFIDGKSIGAARTESAPGAAECSVQIGCLDFRPGNDLSKLERLFSGRMAELAVYERPLTLEEIQQHASFHRPHAAGLSPTAAGR